MDWDVIVLVTTDMIFVEVLRYHWNGKDDRGFEIVVGEFGPVWVWE